MPWALAVLPRHTQMLCYFVPDPAGETAAGDRRMNWAWYCNVPEGEELRATLIDRSGLIPTTHVERLIGSISSESLDHPGPDTSLLGQECVGFSAPAEAWPINFGRASSSIRPGFSA